MEGFVLIFWVVLSVIVLMDLLDYVVKLILMSVSLIFVRIREFVWICLGCFDVYVC